MEKIKIKKIATCRPAAAGKNIVSELPRTIVGNYGRRGRRG